MSNIFADAFSNQPTEEEQTALQESTDDTPASERGLTAVVTPVDELGFIPTPPLSRLKQQRLKEKQKKEQRKMKKEVNTRRERMAARAEPTKAFNAEEAKWDEAKLLAMQVWGNLDTYVGVAASATMLVNRQDVIVDEDTRNYVTHRVNVYSGDIENFRKKWQEIGVEMEGKDGKVKDEEYPIFYVVYNDYIMLQQDINSVLSEQAAELSDIINMIITKVDELVKQQTDQAGQPDGQSAAAESLQDDSSGVIMVDSN